MQTLSQQSYFRTKSQALFTLYINRHKDFPPHNHDFFELAFVLGGRAIQRSSGGACRIGRGHVTLLHPGVWHGYEQSHMELFICLIAPGLFKRELSWVADDPMLAPLFHPAKNPTDCLTAKLGPLSLKRCRAHLEALHSLRYSVFENTRALQISYLLLLLHEMAQTFSKKMRKELCRPSTLHPSVKRAIELMESDCASRWSLTSLAGKLNINPSYLSRIFHSQTSLSPMRYLSRKRAERAATLLISTDKSISEIGEMVGWPEPKVFARSFKAHFSISASQYRAAGLQPSKS